MQNGGCLANRPPGPSASTKRTMTEKAFTVYALCYGDYPGLAERCLRSILSLPIAPNSAPSPDRAHVAEVRVALNAPSSATRWAVAKLTEEDRARGRQAIR